MRYTATAVMARSRSLFAMSCTDFIARLVQAA
jgi:hypothetical protein